MKVPPATETRSRRRFMSELGGAAMALGLAGDAYASVERSASRRVSPEAGADPRAMKVPVVIFSKHLQWLNYADMGRLAAEMGFDGVDLTVRPRGHVLPERVTEDLPRAVQAIRSAGVGVYSLTTSITDPDDPHTEPILKTAGELGIRIYRLGYWSYDLDLPIPPQLAAFRRKARGLADMNSHYGLSGDYQNHAGAKYVGAAIWDLWDIIRNLDETALGCQFDVRHATVEGATGWPVSLRLIASRIHSVIAKDFVWQRGTEGWQPTNTPLGQGMVEFEPYFAALKAAEFAGPVIVHYEYPLGGADRGGTELTIPRNLFAKKVQADLAQVHYWLAAAGLRS